MLYTASPLNNDKFFQTLLSHGRDKKVRHIALPKSGSQIKRND